MIDKTHPLAALIAEKANDARDVFDGTCDTAKQSVDYFEQLLLAALEAAQPPADYTLAPHLQKIVEGAKTAPQWDMEKDRFTPRNNTMPPDLVEVLEMSARIWANNAEADKCPTFSRGDCREWAERYANAAAMITAQAAQIAGMIDADTVQKMLDSAQPIMAEACRGSEETIADLRTDVATLRAMQAEREAALQELRFHVDDAVKAWNAHEAAEAKLAEVEKERERQQFRGDNHWETLRSIRDIATSTGDIARIVQWVNDAGSGYTETAETTLSAEMDRRLAAEATVASLQAQVEAMRGALEQIAWSNDSKWQADCARAALEGKA